MVWSSLSTASRHIPTAVRTGHLRHGAQFHQNKRLRTDGLGGKETVAEVLKRFKASEASEKTSMIKDKFDNNKKEGAAAIIVGVGAALCVAWSQFTKNVREPVKPKQMSMPIELPRTPALVNMQPAPPDQPCEPCAVDETSKSEEMEDSILTATPCVNLSQNRGQDVLIPETVSDVKTPDANSGESSELMGEGEPVKRRRRKSKASKQERDEE